MRRRAVVEGVVVGAAVAGAHRPPAVAVVPAPYYGYGAAPVGAAAMYGAAARPTTEVMINTGPGYMPPPPNPGYYPPPPMQQDMAPYPSPYPPAAPYPGPAPYQEPHVALYPDPYRQPPVEPFPGPMPPPMVVEPAPMPPPHVVPPVAPLAPVAPHVVPPVAPAVVVAPHVVPPIAPAAVVIEPAAPAVVPAAIAAGAAVKAAEAVAVVKAFEKRPCYLVNEATNTVLEVRRGSAKPGAEVVLEKRHKDRPQHQLWYLDEHEIIHSCLNDFVIESKGNEEHVHMKPLTGDARQKWTHKNNRIHNMVFCNDCIGAKKGLVRVKDDADVISCVYEGKPYQHWRIEFI